MIEYPTQNVLREIFLYDHESGNLLWKKKITKKVMVGFAAGYKNKNGYIVIKLFGQVYQAHRLIWIYENGNIPDGMQIDHADCVKDNNTIDNLRLATDSQNKHNLPLRKNNTSGYKGVSFDKKKSKWVAQIKTNGQRLFLGYFEHPGDASAAYKAAAEKHFGEFSRA